MIDTVLSILAPHHCCGCSKTGSLLCGNCKYNIISEPFEACLVCQKPTRQNNLCNLCNVPYSRAWVVTIRRDTVQRLIDIFKFENAKNAYKPLGDLLLATLPDLPTHTVVVPVPTISKHIRRRGYDHVYLVARYIATKRGLSLSTRLERASQTTQLGMSATKRRQQAKTAFQVNGNLDSKTVYLLIDDIYTTGSTVRYAAEELKHAGAGDVWVAIIARQTLD